MSNRAFVRHGVSAGLTTESAPDEKANLILLGRQVEGPFIVDLNKATQGLGKKVPRVLDVFTMGLVYAHRLTEARAHSELEEPPTVEDMAGRFGKLPRRVHSLAKPVQADVLDVRATKGEVAVYVDYPEYHEERLVLSRALARYLGLPHLYQASPTEPHIVIAGQLTREEQVAQIADAIPARLDLSAMRPVSSD